MSVIAKMIAVRFPRPHMPGRKSDVMEFTEGPCIKQSVHDCLFKEQYDYVVLSYNGKLFVCEKSTDTQYARYEVPYHPLYHALALT